jgi:hypothetical protein
VKVEPGGDHSSERDEICCGNRKAPQLRGFLFAHRSIAKKSNLLIAHHRASSAPISRMLTV